MEDLNTQHLMLLASYEKRRDDRDIMIAEAKARHKAELQAITDQFNVSWAQHPLDVLIELERNKIFEILQTDGSPLFEQYGMAEIQMRSSIEVTDEYALIEGLLDRAPSIVERKIRKAQFNDLVKQDPNVAADLPGWQVKITPTLTVKLNK